MTKSRKTILLENAARLFVKHGYANTTTRMLAKAVGIQAPAIYHHFKSKKEILRQIDEEAWFRFQKMVFDQLKTTIDPVERIRLYIKNMITYQLMQGEKNWMVDSEEARKINKNRKNHDRIVFDFIRETLKEISRKRGLRESVDTSIATFSLFSLTTRVYKWYNPHGTLGVEEITDQITNIFLHGFLGSGEERTE